MLPVRVWGSLILLVVTVLIAVSVPAEPAEAACRPTTIADLPPLPGPEPPAAAPAPTDGTVLPPSEPAPPVEAPPPPPPRRCRFLYRMLFPVLGGKIGSIFGEARDGGARRHLGVDIVAPRLTPLIAVYDGVVEDVHGPGPECCWLKIRHDDGWFSVYLHLNNDTAGTDDGRGSGIRPGIEVGTRVTAGQVIGWMGDSGNAEPTVPHLHFELRNRGGVPVDPHWSLHTARRRGIAPSLKGVEGSFSIPFVDDDDRVEAEVFVLLTSLGAMSPCDTWGVRVCPLDPISIQDASQWVSTLMDVDVPLRLPGPDLTITAEESLLADAFSCLEGACPLHPLTVGVAARMLRWAVNHQDVTEQFLTPDPSYWLEDATVAWDDLSARGLLSDCADPLTPDTILSRATFARLLAQVTERLPVVVCDGVT